MSDSHLADQVPDVVVEDRGCAAADLLAGVKAPSKPRRVAPAVVRARWEKRFRKAAEADACRWLRESVCAADVTGAQDLDDYDLVEAIVEAQLRAGREPVDSVVWLADKTYGMPAEAFGLAYAVHIADDSLVFAPADGMRTLDLADRCAPFLATWIEVVKLHGEFAPEEAESVAAAIEWDLDYEADGAFCGWQVDGWTLRVDVDPMVFDED